MKKILIGLMAMAALAAPADAAAEAGELDRSFGPGGRIVTPASFAVPWSRARVQLAVGPLGQIVAGTEEALIGYHDDGHLDGSFGSGGILSVSMPAGFRFILTDLGIDPEGRVVAVGDATKGRSSRAAALRYLPSGAPDLSFGGGDGVVLGRFGLRGESVVAPLARVDEEGRITLVVGSRHPGRRCGPRRSDRMIVRLTPEGRLDPSFGNLGRHDLQPLARVTALAADPSGGVVLAGPERRTCGEEPVDSLIRLREDGSRVGHFGDHGKVRFKPSIASIAIDSRRRIVILFAAEQLPKRREQETVIVRVLPSGDLDRTFFDGGVGFSAQGRYQWHNVAIRPGDRPLLIGTLIRPPGENNDLHRWFLAVPLRPHGKFEAEASWRGWAWFTRFSGAEAAASEALIDSQNRLLVAGTTRWPGVAPRGGFALARFELL